MRISIAMATYNGADYLQEQLDSFVAQTRQPDELVVCDDGSTDGTKGILHRFARKATFEVRIVENEVNIGYKKNFEKTMTLCSGDIIFLSDQDDVWFKEKIFKVIQDFLGNPEKMVVINDQFIADERLSNSGVTTLGNTRALGYKDSWFVWGCCTAFRKEWVKLALPIPEYIKSHDIWINNLAEALGTRFIHEDPLQLYRRHGRNASEAETNKCKKLSQFTLLKMYGLNDAREGWKKEIRDLEPYQEHLNGRRKDFVEFFWDKTLDEALDRMKEKRESLDHRITIVSLPRWRRCFPLYAFWVSGGYRYMSGWKSALKDLIRP
ncbi:Glycosyltransferase involved in cell wall bisynthesis [Thiohalorhabdus denitrificans]|uniref:Glycosyltransferase involved in cell wall bisynthesis n=2 Tax=Thiohalorhabdus denitrificans TaxID=381306 RepID=A0A1G5C796_9GAMM|nr:glycosyltransferase family 2 protein [Thiohalorhabdus denitrificans]SCX98200.1 Glycosyltransferase involved in cell wall bisynthesis [Thiohalorhabdus denitrificans]